MDTELLARFNRAYWQALRDADMLRLRQWEQSHITLPQLRVLYQVRRTPGITTGELAHTLGVTMSTASGLVIKLVDHGLVRRAVAESDRRQVPLNLTPEGQTLVGELADESRSFVRQVAEQLGQDLPAVVAALEQLATATATVRADEPTTRALEARA